MVSLLIAEWLRFRHRRDLWFIVGAVLGLAAFSFLSSASSAGRVEFAPIDPTLPPDVAAEIERQNAVIEAQMAQVRDRYLWPWSLIQILDLGASLFIGTTFVAASWLGSEYAWGTIRNVVLTEPRRGRVFVARVVAVGLVGLGSVVLLLALGAILPAFLSMTGTGAPPPLSPIAVVASAGVAWLWAAAFGALAILAAVLTRSSALAFALAAGYGLLEQGVANLDVWRATGLTIVPKFFLIARLTALKADVETAFQTAPPFAAQELGGERLDPILGLAVLSLWIAVFLGLAGVLFVRADIRE